MGKIKLQDVKKAIDIGKDVLPLVEPAVSKYGPALIDWGATEGQASGRQPGGSQRLIPFKGPGNQGQAGAEKVTRGSPQEGRGKLASANLRQGVL